MDRIPNDVTECVLKPHSARAVNQTTGGLSSASVFRCESPQGWLCLRRWPEKFGLAKLEQIRAQCNAAIQQGIRFLPRHLPLVDGSYFFGSSAGYWEITTWLPGKATYVREPNDCKLASGMRSLASLHRVWQEPGNFGNSPAVLDRQNRLEYFLSGTGTGQLQRSLEFHFADANELPGRTVDALLRFGPGLRMALDDIAKQPVDLQYVVRDVWSEHVLFEGNEVSGIVDFGAARIDERATDLARLLGSFEPFDRSRWAAGLSMYRQELSIDGRRVAILDAASCLLAAVQWLIWLHIEPREFAAPKHRLVQRWQTFIDRLERFQWPFL